MNDKVKTFLLGIATAISGIILLFIRTILHNQRDTANTIGDNDRQSAELTERVGGEIEDLGSRTEQSKSDYSAAKQTIAEIRKNQQITEDYNIGDECDGDYRDHITYYREDIEDNDLY